MLARSTPPTNIDEYIAGFPPDVQAMLQKIRLTIRNAAPEAQETIKYLIPTFTLRGNLISFAAYKQHIGLYPAPSGTVEFNKALAAYRAEKSSVRFPLDGPIPYDLIGEMVRFRMQDMENAAARKSKK